jgi:chromosome segregation ATPase
VSFEDNAEYERQKRRLTIELQSKTNELESVKSSLSTLKAKHKELQDDYDLQRKLLKQDENLAKNFELEKGELEWQIGELTTENEKLSEQLNSFESDKAQLEDEYQKKVDELQLESARSPSSSPQNSQDNKERLLEEIKILHGVIELIKQDKEAAEEQYELLLSSRNKLKTDYETKKGFLLKLNTTSERMKKEFDSVTYTHADHESKIKELHRQIQKLRDQIAQKGDPAAEIESLQRQFNDKEALKKSLEREIEALQNRDKVKRPVSLLDQLEELNDLVAQVQELVQADGEIDDIPTTSSTTATAPSSSKSTTTPVSSKSTTTPVSSKSSTTPSAKPQQQKKKKNASGAKRKRAENQN